MILRRGFAILSCLLAGCSAPRYGEQPAPPLVLERAPPSVPAERCEPSAEPVAPSGRTPLPEAQGELHLLEVRGDDRLAFAGPTEMTWSNDAERVITAGEEGVSIWRASTGELLRHIDLGARLERARRVIVSPDDRWIAVAGDLPEQASGASTLWIVRADGGGGARRFARIGTNVSFTPDSERLFTDGHTWELATGVHAQRPPLADEMMFLPDGRRAIVFVGQGAHQIHLPELRDVASGRVVHRFPAIGPTTAAALSGDGRRFALLNDAGLSVYSMDTFERVAHVSDVEGAGIVHLSRDGRRAVVEGLICAVALSSAAKTAPRCSPPELAVWDLDRGARLLRTRQGAGNGLHFTRDGEYLTGGSNSGRYLLRIRDGAVLRFGSRIRTIAPDSRRLLFDGKLGVEMASLDASTPALSFARAPRVLSRSADGRLTAAVGSDGRLRIEGAGTCVRLGVTTGPWIEPSAPYDHLDPETARLAFSSDGTSLFMVLASSSQRPLFRAYDTRDGAERWSIRAIGRDGGGSAHVLPAAGQVVFQGTSRPEVLRFDAVTGAALPTGFVPRVTWSTPLFGGQTFEVRDADGPRGQNLMMPAAARDGLRVAAPSIVENVCRLSIWDLRDPLHVEDRRSGCIRSRPALSPDERWLAAGYADGRIGIFSFRDNRSHTVADKHAARVTTLAFAPASDRVASAAADGTILLADPATGRVTGRARLPLDRAEHLWISPDGRELVADTARGLEVRFRIAEPARRELP